MPAAGPDAPPGCYRHPDRETYVRCTRCERPICPECMVPASVGFHCPDDVREGQQGVRAARTVLGGRPSAAPARLSLVLIGVNVAVFLVGLVEPTLTARFGQVAARPAPPLPPVTGVAAGEFYRLITAAFLHQSLFHLLSNMLALASFGPPLEAALGRARFLTVYVLSALGGSTLSLLFNRPDQYGIGASGAVFGLLGAYYVVARRLGAETATITVMLLVNLALPLAVPLIDWRAHLGGLAVGAVLAAAFAAAPRRSRTAWQAAAGVATAVMLAVAVLLRVSALQG